MLVNGDCQWITTLHYAFQDENNLVIHRSVPSASDTGGGGTNHPSPAADAACERTLVQMWSFPEEPLLLRGSTCSGSGG